MFSDVRIKLKKSQLAAKGDELLFEDLWQYKGGNVSSDHERYIMVYKIEGGYRLALNAFYCSKCS